MGVGAILLAAWVVASAMGATAGFDAQASTIGTVLVAGTFGFGILKFLIVLFPHSVAFGFVRLHGTIFAWFGLILLLAVAYGRYMQMQEPKTTSSGPPAPAGGGITP